MNSDSVSQVALAGPEASLSYLSMFFEADIVVKLVMLGLIFASVWSWAIIFDRAVLFSRAKRQMNRFEGVFWSGQSLEDLYNSLSARANNGMAALFVAAMKEWKRSHEGDRPAIASLQQRIDRTMDLTIAREVERFEKRLMFLATVGTAAPFIGLFGTVWGIMNSFASIAASKNTSLAVVAPGIAEALFATGLGLVAAIPAVIAYNKLQADAGKLSARMEGFADEFSAILSRRIDERV
ncbi:protein TolQ [Flexibacterium corallicola]|uniref:protein TolQ n=1 Tax=Flexibacterium corallicola TaxID=3037259 RepID=UPI00286EC3DA|nr:protein TolQ [Pseudovibrio sp. M1P-2-3]